MDAMINLVINIIQSFLFIHFLVKCFGVKELDIGKKSIYVIGVFVTLIYLELPAVFSEGNNALSYIVIAVLFSVLFLKGQLIEQVLYSILLVAVTIYTTILVGSLLGLIQRLNYIDIRDLGGIITYIAMAVTQLILGGVLYLLAKYKNKISGTFHTKYTFIYVTIPIISVVLCTAVLEMFHSEVIRKNEQILIIMLGIFLLNLLVTYLYLVQHRYYNRALEDSVQLRSYEQHQLNIEEIKRAHQETEKNRHEIKRVIQMTMSLLENGNGAEAMSYLEAFEDTRMKEVNQQILIDHLVLNATITQKMEICRTNNISMNCLVTGIVEGVTDLDLHILVDNLLENAIEASKRSEERKIDFILSADETYIIIEINNSTYGNVLKNNKNLSTTKKEKKTHGYGIKNIRDVVEKYQGQLSYHMPSDKFIKCEVILLKAY